MMQITAEVTHPQNAAVSVQKLATRGNCILIQMDAHGLNHVGVFVSYITMTAVNHNVCNMENKRTNLIAPMDVVRNVDAIVQSIQLMTSSNVKINVQGGIKLSTQEVWIDMDVQTVAAHVHHFHLNHVKPSATEKGRF